MLVVSGQTERFRRSVGVRNPRLRVQSENRQEDVTPKKQNLQERTSTLRQRRSSTKRTSDVLRETDLNSPERVKRPCHQRRNSRDSYQSTSPSYSSSSSLSEKSDSSKVKRKHKPKPIYYESSTSDDGPVIDFNHPNFEEFKRQPKVQVKFKSIGELVEYSSQIVKTVNLPGNLVYVVESISDHRWEGKNLMFEIKWKDWDSHWNTWEPESVIGDCTSTATLLLHVVEYFFEKKKCSDKMYEYLKKFVKKFVLDEESVDCFIVAKFANESLPMNNDRTEKPNAKQLKDLQAIVKKRLSENDWPCLLKAFGSFASMLKIIKDRIDVLDDNERWSNMIARLEPKADVDIENLVDTEKLPSFFKYITDYVVSPKVKFIPPTKFCRCSDESCFEDSCCGMHSGKDSRRYRGYNSAGKLNHACSSVPLWECNSRCQCDDQCENRLIQKGLRHELVLFKTHSRGWGVRTSAKIAKGTFVAEYLGELMTSQEAVKRHSINFSYLFDLKPFKERPIENTVDAAVYGNISRFFNHSCDPNMAISYAYIENHNLAAPRLAFFARRNIARDEELTFNYRMQKTGEKGTLSRFECKCGAARCGKYLY